MTFLQSWAVVAIAACGGVVQGYGRSFIACVVAVVCYSGALFLIRYWGGIA